jgi:hypothetical protein
MRREWMTAVLVVGACFLGLFASQSPRSLQLGEDSGALMFQKRMLRDSDVRCAFDLSSSRQMDQVASDGVEAGPQVLDLRVVSKLSNQRLVSFQDPGGEDESLPGGGGPGGPAPTSVLVIDVNGPGDFGPTCSAQSPGGDPGSGMAFPTCSVNGGSAASPDRKSNCSVQSNGTQTCSVNPGQTLMACSVVEYIYPAPSSAPPVPTCSVYSNDNYRGFCSVKAVGGQVEPTQPLFCSVGPNSAASNSDCSVRRMSNNSDDRNMTCSVFSGEQGSAPAGTTYPGCSVFIGRAGTKMANNSCSVVDGVRRNASCSVFGGAGTKVCSVEAAREKMNASCSVHHSAAAVPVDSVRTCSVRLSPADSGESQCSTLHQPLPQPLPHQSSNAICSVIAMNPQDKSYCSVFQVPAGGPQNQIRCSSFNSDPGSPLPGSQRCSTYVDDNVSTPHSSPSRCSVLVPQPGGGIEVVPSIPLGSKCVQP